MSKYFQLVAELEELRGDYNTEFHDDMRREIQDHITHVSQLLGDYDLEEDDLFRCSKCGTVPDVEDSIEVGRHQLFCEICAKKKS